MNLYLFKRTDAIDWDEYIGFVVRAESPERAYNKILEHVGTRYFEWGNDSKENWQPGKETLLATDVEGEAEIVLADFHNG